MNSIFADLETTVFETMSELARRHAAINLGQGFPDDQGPLDVREAAARAVIEGSNQYPPMPGLPQLREAIAQHYAKHQGVTLDPMSEVMVTSGATEALAASLLTLIEPGDEVVLFEPLYDAYLPLVRRAGGVPRIVTLAPPEWRFDRAMLERAFGPRTRVVVLNSPLNPAGSIVSAEELDLLAEFAERYDAVVVADEVWEHVTFEGRPHRSVLQVQGLRERAVKIGSAGKIFSLTGWKVGLVAAAPPLLKAVARAHQFLTFTTPPNLQAAVAFGLLKEPGFFDDQRRRLEARRDRFAHGLEALGLTALPCHATYFLNLDIGPLGASDDARFCRELVERHGVAAIPVSAFYAEGRMRHVVRFCFAKEETVLDAALERLSRLRHASC